jgi:hypothetical protein
MVMRHILLKSVICLVALGLFAARANAAISFTFDPTGTPGAGGDVAGVTTLDWDPNNALSVEGLTAINSFYAIEAAGGFSPIAIAAAQAAALPFTTYAHGKLDGFSGGALPADGSEITFVAGFGERVTGVALVGGNLIATFDDGVGAANFFQIYYQKPGNADPLAGTGYGDGTLILSGVISNVFSSTGFNVNDFNAGNLDQHLTDDYPLINTVGGDGHAKIEGPVSYFDPNFFPSGFTSPGLTLFSIFQSNLSVPFLGVDPSAAFNLVGGGPAVTEGAGLGIVSLGTVNGQAIPIGGGGGPDFQFQQDGNSTFELLAVPEPTGIALWSLGLAMVFGSRARSNWRRKK